MQVSTIVLCLLFLLRTSMFLILCRVFRLLHITLKGPTGSIVVYSTTIFFLYAEQIDTKKDV